MLLVGMPLRAGCRQLTMRLPSPPDATSGSQVFNALAFEQFIESREIALNDLQRAAAPIWLAKDAAGSSPQWLFLKSLGRDAESQPDLGGAQ
jgi:hypothetical protein